jgi:hypothetical protein
MSDHSLKRSLFFALSSLFVAASLFAVEPSARYEAEFVYNPKTTHSILFGGLTAIDAATKVPYELNDTWDWNGTRWTLLYPTHSPAVRAAHAMAIDTKRSQIVLFGGRTGHAKTDLNDTWIFNGFDWTEAQPATSPSERAYSGLAYDSTRDRFVLFGGAHAESDGKTSTTYHDTWEFDGTNWTKTNDSGPDIVKPKLAYDEDTRQMILVGADSTFVTHMYVYDSAGGSWNEQKPANLPACFSGGSLAYLPDAKLVIATGGICTSSPTTEDVVAWDGTDWHPVTATNTPARLFDAAVTYDQSRQTTLVFGGVSTISLITTAVTPLPDLNAFAGTVWSVRFDSTTPPRRSLPVFVTDPDRNAIWMTGGVNEVESLADLWKVQSGSFELQAPTGGPGACNPTGAYDSDRHLLVVVCTDSTTFEFDGTTWTPAGAKNYPPARRFSSIAYDKTLKKTVLFGGYNGSNYSDETWLWDGTNWTQAEGDSPGLRADAQMWFDPQLQKTVLYGGVGRQSQQDRVVWFSDIWTFDGSKWTQLLASPTPFSAAPGTPGMRYGADIAIDPRSNKLLLYGGIRIDRIGGDPNSSCTSTTCKSVYADDWWEWDGGTQKWTTRSFVNTPPPRENAGFAFDPSLNTMVMFGGYTGTFLSDLWVMTPGGDSWRPVFTNPVRMRPTR